MKPAEFLTWESLPFNPSEMLTQASKILNNRITVAVIFGLLLVLSARVLTIENSDFYKAYFPAADSVLRTGTFEYATDGFKSFANLPLISYLFVPIVTLGEEASGTAFLISEVVFYFVAFVVALRFLSKSTADTWMLFFLFLFTRHYYTSIQFGQLTILTFLLLLLAYIAYWQDRKYLTGILVTSAFLLKIPAGFMFAYFLYKREWKTVSASAVMYIAVVLVSLIAFGLSLHMVYFDYTVLSNAGTTLTAYNNPTLSAFAMRFVVPEGLFVWQLVAIPTYMKLLVTGGIVALVIYLARTIGSRQLESWDLRKLEFSLGICASLVVFPLVWDHYYLFSIIPFFVGYQAIRETTDKKRLLIAIWAISFVLINLPVLSFIDAQRGVIPFLADLISSSFIRNLLPSSLMFGSFALMSLLIIRYRELRGALESNVSEHRADSYSQDATGIPMPNKV